MDLGWVPAFFRYTGVNRLDARIGPFEFWGSELYRRGLTLMDGIRGPRDLRAVFTPEEQHTFAQRAADANASGRGGRAIFYCARA